MSLSSAVMTNHYILSSRVCNCAYTVCAIETTSIRISVVDWLVAEKVAETQCSGCRKVAETLHDDTQKAVFN